MFLSNLNLSTIFQAAAFAAVAFFAPELGIPAWGAQMAATFAVSVVASRIFAPNVPQAQQNNIRQQVPPDPTAGIPLVYGDAYTGARFCDAVLTSDQQAMYYVMVISCISPNGQFSFDTSKFYYQDQIITFDTTDLTKVVSLTDGAGNVDTSISGHLYINLYTSSQSGTITPINSSNLPSAVMTNANGCPSGQEWPSTGRQMNGLAFAIVKLVYNNNSAGTTSLQPITFHVSHYLNSTGAAKAGDVWYDYLTNTVYGGAIDPAFVDAASATALNAYGDQLITYTPYGGGSASQPRYRFNGVLDTGQTVLSNIDIMMTCCDCWQSYQVVSGKWSVTINRDITPTFSFDDNNIIGNITASELDITQMVNQIEAKFNDSTNRDQAGYVNLQTPANLLYQNEPVNKFTVSYDLVNNSVTAQYLANRTLEQNREDLIVSFSTNYTGIQVNAGDVVTVTNGYYGWSAKQFRVMQVKEVSLPDGSLGAGIQLIEYNSAVYDTGDITQFVPAPNSGIASPNYFSALTAPTATGYPSASIPHIDVSIVVPTTGRVTTGTLFYTTSASPAISDWNTLITIKSANNQPVTNGITFVFTDNVLPAGTYYFAFTVGSETNNSPLSPKSAAFVWNPVGMSGASGASGASGYSGYSGSSGTGSTGPRSASGYIYYSTATASAPATPSASGYNFTTGAFSSLTSGWTTTFTAPDPVTNASTQAGSKFWAVRYNVSEATFGGTQTVTISSPFNWQNLNGLVTFTNVTTSSGTTFIDGGNIITDTLVVDKIKNNSSGTFNTYGSFGLGTGSTLGAYQAAGVFASTNASLFGLLSGNTAGGNAIGAGTTGTIANSVAITGVGSSNSTFSTWKNQGNLGAGDAGGSFQTGGASNLQSATTADIRLAYYNGGTSYAFYIYSGASYPFTAGHDAMQLLTEAIPDVGDLMVDVALIAAPTVNDGITQMTVSTKANQKGVIGVYTGVTGTDFVPAALAEYVAAPDGTISQIQFKPEYADIYSTYRCIGVNAIGEGKMNVCGQGGNIEIGDLICASDMAGKGMKQGDDLYHAYTVAKARQAVIFTSPDQVVQIACIYVSG
jgi:hypothetical protein